MSSLSDLQSRLQADILGDGRNAEDLIAPAPRGSRASRLNGDHKALLLSLTDILRRDYEKLHLYLGKSQFVRMVKDYAEVCTSDMRKTRWCSRHLPTFLEHWPTSGARQELTELAILEQALRMALTSPPEVTLSLQELALTSMDTLSGWRFRLASASGFLCFRTNATSIFSSLRAGETPPLAQRALPIQHILIWKQSGGSRFRFLGEEEMMALSGLKGDLPFARICELTAIYGGSEGAEVRALTYLRGWVESELLIASRPELDHSISAIGARSLC